MLAILQSKKIILTGILFLVSSVALLSFSQKSYALLDTTGSKGAACAGINGTTDATGSCSNTGENSIASLIKTVINILSLVVGLAAVIMIIVSALRLIISGGDPNSTSGAKSGIIYALIGLVVAVFAQVLVHFVLNRTTMSTSSSSSNSSTP